MKNKEERKKKQKNYRKKEEGKEEGRILNQVTTRHKSMGKRAK